MVEEYQVSSDLKLIPLDDSTDMELHYEHSSQNLEETKKDIAFVAQVEDKISLSSSSSLSKYITQT